MIGFRALFVNFFAFLTLVFSYTAPEARTTDGHPVNGILIIYPGFDLGTNGDYDLHHFISENSYKYGVDFLYVKRAKGFVRISDPEGLRKFEYGSAHLKAIQFETDENFPELLNDSKENTYSISFIPAPENNNPGNQEYRLQFPPHFYIQSTLEPFLDIFKNYEKRSFEIPDYPGKWIGTLGNIHHAPDIKHLFPYLEKHNLGEDWIKLDLKIDEEENDRKLVKEMFRSAQDTPSNTTLPDCERLLNNTSS